MRLSSVASIIWATALFLPVAFAAPRKPTRDLTVPPDTGFVLEVEVQEIGASHFADEDVPLSNMYQAKLLSVIYVREGFQFDISQFVGQSLTFQTKRLNDVGSGNRMAVFAASWKFGETLGLRDLKHVEIRDLASFKSEFRSAMGKAREGELIRRIQAAELIVAGNVKEIVDGPSGPVSEKSPLWKIARIEIQQKIKGGFKSKMVEVAFPSSNDHRYVHVPKFRVGQEAVWFLSKTSLDFTFRPRKMFTVLSSEDWHESSELDRVIELAEKAENGCEDRLN